MSFQRHCFSAKFQRSQNFYDFSPKILLTCCLNFFLSEGTKNMTKLLVEIVKISNHIRQDRHLKKSFENKFKEILNCVEKKK